jgi:hypothetical protein
VGMRCLLHAGFDRRQHLSTRIAPSRTRDVSTCPPRRTSSRYTANPLWAGRRVLDPPRDTWRRFPSAQDRAHPTKHDSFSRLLDESFHALQRAESVFTFPLVRALVRATGLEPARLSTPGPKSLRVRFSGGGWWWEMLSELEFRGRSCWRVMAGSGWFWGIPLAIR